MDVTVNGIPIEIEEITVTAFGAKVGYEAKREDTTGKQLEPIRLTGVWTKDGKFVKAAGGGENRTFDALKDVATAQGLVSNSHPRLLDPAGVTAVSLGDIRIDLNKLTALKTASKEEQAKILEARKLIINSTSWVADGFNANTIDADGNRVPLPHFSELFPGWEMPVN